MTKLEDSDDEEEFTPSEKMSQNEEIDPAVEAKAAARMSLVLENFGNKGPHNKLRFTPEDRAAILKIPLGDPLDVDKPSVDLAKIADSIGVDVNTLRQIADMVRQNSYLLAQYLT